MNWQKAIPAAIIVCALTLLTGCGASPDKAQPPSEDVPNVVTRDIQDGIEKHIAERSRLGEGYFNLTYEDRQLRLKLVRVHTEYLANLGPRRHFACVDLATVDGDVYDVDFFLAGDPGDMTVTETTAHKFNGRPFYVWKQKRDKTWHRLPVEGATPQMLGAITGRDEFDFLYRATLPDIDAPARMWIPMPATDAFQTVEVISIDAPGKRQILRESKHGNRVLFLALGPDDSQKTVALRFRVQRLEKGVYPGRPPAPGQYLQAARLVPDDQRFQTIADDVLKGKQGDLERARALYDHVIKRMRYMKYGTGWGKGDALYACSAKTGNCSDFHSYFIALSRAAGIPARFAIGASIPSERNSGGIDGYHCWAEFYTRTDQRWWPVDISEGDKCSALSTYYFGHHPANRIELSRGRDLILNPGPAAEPINFLAYPIFEINGQPQKIEVEFSFNRNSPPATP